MLGVPASQPVVHEAHVAGVRDERGNVTDTWLPGVTVYVYAHGPRSTDEPKVAGHDRETVTYEISAPATFSPGAKDRVICNGERFEVIGETEQYNNAPFGLSLGNVINLKRWVG